MKKIFSIVLSFVLAQNLVFAAQPMWSQTPEVASDFTLLDLENKEFSLSDFKGKPVILFFWTTWCPHCRRGLKQLNTAYADLSKNGVELLAINIEESPDKVQRFLEKNPLSYRVLLDTDAIVAEAYGILGVPTYILIDKEGRIVFNNHYFPEGKYKELILQ